MTEAYFEEENKDLNGIQYPFHSCILNSKGKTVNILPHWHYYIELLYFLEGNALIFLGGKHYNISSGNFIIINSREIHSICCEDEINTRYIIIKLDPDVLYSTTRTVFEAKYILPFTMSKYNHQKVFSKKELENTHINNLIWEIHEEYLNKSYGFELAVRTGIGKLFLWIIRNWEKNGIKVSVESIPREIDILKLQHLLDYLDKHYAEEISAEEMAKMSNMSYSYFSRFFKKIMRKTFTEYLNYIRVTEAEKLLLTTDMNITEVALSTGFSNSSYFIKQFKNYKNLSPKQFKMKIL